MLPSLEALALSPKNNLRTSTGFRINFGDGAVRTMICTEGKPWYMSFF